MNIPSSDVFREFFAELLFSIESIIKYASLDHSVSLVIWLYFLSLKDVVCQNFCISVVCLQLVVRLFWSPSNLLWELQQSRESPHGLMCLHSGSQQRLGWVKVLCTNNIHWGDFSFFLAPGNSDVFLSGVFVIGDGVGNACFLPELSWDIHIFWYRNSITFCLGLWK